MSGGDLPHVKEVVGSWSKVTGTMSGSALFSSSDWGRALMTPKSRRSEVAIEGFIVQLPYICLG